MKFIPTLHSPSNNIDGRGLIDCERPATGREADTSLEIARPHSYAAGIGRRYYTPRSQQGVLFRNACGAVAA